MHLEGGGVHKKSRTDEFFVLLMVTQHVADILTQKALDALPEFLNPIDVRLLHAPRSVGRVGLPRRELLDLLLDLEVPRYIGYEISHMRERAHRLDSDRLRRIELLEPRHAHQLRHAVDF